jgi:membrane protein DedA with SNARE-associated domain
LHGYFETLTQYYAGNYGYAILFLGVSLEGVGVPVPGESAVLVAGFVASSAGGGRLSLPLVIAVTFVAAVVGDNFGYWLGKHFARPRLRRSQGFLFLTPERFQWVEGYFERHGRWAVFLARFITGVRVVCAMAAGTAGMPWKQFVLANAAGAAFWAVAVSLAGYYFGKSWKLLHYWLGWGSWMILAVVIFAVAVCYILTRMSNPNRTTPK